MRRMWQEALQNEIIKLVLRAHSDVSDCHINRRLVGNLDPQINEYTKNWESCTFTIAVK